MGHAAGTEAHRVARSSELHLLVRSDAERDAGLRALVPLAGVSYLLPGATPPELKRRRPRPACLAFEPVAGELEGAGQPRLLVLVPAGLRARWNASPAPPVLLMRVGDELRLPGGLLLHLSEFVSAEIGPTPAELVGRPCAVCRLPLAVGASVLACRGCGVPLHAAGPSEPDRERDPVRDPVLDPGALDCAGLAETCPACDTALRVGGEYAWLPAGGGPIHA